MSKLDIRPHHGLCINFFEGKGYSEDFTRNMYSVIGMLETEDPEVTLTLKADAVCAYCPNNQSGICRSEEKVKRYDSEVLDLCGYKEGRIINWKEFKGNVRKSIIGAGKLEDICFDCEWRGICHTEVR